MLEFHPKASGSSGNFYLASDGGHTLAIECGVRYGDIQVACDFNVSCLAGCLVSHSHGDHIKAAAEMMKAGCDCFASADTWDDYNRRWGKPHHRQRVITAGREFAAGPFKVIAFEVPHDMPGTMGFHVEGPSGERLVYITDAQYCPVRAEDFQRIKFFCVEANYEPDTIIGNARTGVIDRGRMRRTISTHTSLQESIRMLKRQDLSKTEAVYLLHLSADNADEISFKDAVERAIGIPVRIAGGARV